MQLQFLSFSELTLHKLFVGWYVRWSTSHEIPQWAGPYPPRPSPHCDVLSLADPFRCNGAFLEGWVGRLSPCRRWELNMEIQYGPPMAPKPMEDNTDWASTD